MPWLAAGCVVPEPEKFREPERSPPILDLDSAAPPTNQLVQVRTGTPFVRTFTIRVRSEDLGDRLIGVLFWNYKTPLETNSRYLFPLPASTLDDPRREFSFTPDVLSLSCERTSERAPGCCATLTLVVTHESNLVSEGGVSQPDPELSKGDRAIATWWFAVDSPSDQPSLIDKCPTPANQPPASP
jgi:hypothetical protein